MLDDTSAIVGAASGRIIEAVPETVAIYLYGSRVHRLTGADSDVDLVVVCRILNEDVLARLHQVRLALERDFATPVGMSTHELEEVSYGGRFHHDIFIHRNRSWLFIQEMREHSIRLWGSPVFETISLPDNHTLLKESIRTLNSLRYEASKILLNKELSEEAAMDIVKCTLHATKFFLFANSRLRPNTDDSVNYLIQHYPAYADRLQQLRRWKQSGSASEFTGRESVAHIAFAVLDTFAKTCSSTYRHLNSDPIWILDGFGLLYSWDEGAYRLALDNWMSHQLGTVDTEFVQKSWRQVKHKAQIDPSSLRTWRRATFGKKLREFEEFDHSWTLEHVRPCADAYRLLSAAKRRSIATILLTDTIHTDVTIKEILVKTELNHLVDEVVVSNQINAIKDDGTAFAHAKEYFPPDKALFVGHADEEVAAAVAAGYFSVQIGGPMCGGVHHLSLASTDEFLSLLDFYCQSGADKKQ